MNTTRELTISYRIFKLDDQGKPRKLDEWDFQLAWRFNSENEAIEAIRKYGKSYDYDYIIVPAIKVSGDMQ